jgi:hypothetical protein
MGHGGALDDSDVMRQFLAPVGFGALMLAFAAFQLIRSQAGLLVWFRIALCTAVGLFFIVFGLNGIAANG